MPIYLLDTNALSRLARGIDKGLPDQVACHIDECVLSSIAWYELEYGVARSPDPAKSRQRLVLLRAIFPFVHSFSEDDATEAAALRAYLATLKPNAQPIGPHDVLLAGQALALGAILVTNNVREFTRVLRLMVADCQSCP